MALWYARNVAKAGGGWAGANQAIPAGPQADVSGSLGSITGLAGGVITQPVVRYYNASVLSSTGSNLPNGITCYLLNADGSKHASFLSGLTTTNHPAGHPTAAGTSGWVNFNILDLPSRQVAKYIMVMDQANTAGETGVSIAVNPQVTANGNG